MSNRATVLSEQIRQVISETILLQMRDPNLEGITITRVKVSPDLQFADIRFSAQDDVRDAELLTRSLNKAGGAFRRALAKRVRMRRIPALRFHLDDDIIAERRIEDLLENLHIPPEPEPDAT